MTNIILEVVLPSSIVSCLVTLFTAWWKESNALKKLKSEESRWISQYKLKRRDKLLIEFHELFVETCNVIHVTTKLNENRTFFKLLDKQTFASFDNTLKDFRKKSELVKFYFNENEVEKITQFEEVTFKYSPLIVLLAGLQTCNEEAHQDNILDLLMNSSELNIIEQNETLFDEKKTDIRQLLKEKLRPTLT